MPARRRAASAGAASGPATTPTSSEPAAARPSPDARGALTLERGLRVLELLAGAERSLTVAEMASQLGMHRQAVYRLLTTLTKHQLAARSDSGRYTVGLGLLRLARMASPALQRTTTPHLRRLADEEDVTAHCVVAEGDQAVTLNVVEPTNAAFHISQRAGTRFPLNQAASGMAILAGRPAVEGEPEAVTIGREVGYVVTRGQVNQGAVGVAVPLVDHDGVFLEASIGVVAMQDLEVDRIGQRLRDVAQLIAAAAD